MSRRFLGLAVLVGLAAGACSSTPSPEPTPEGVAEVPIVGCVGVALADCNAIVAQLPKVLQAGRGQPASVQVMGNDCSDGGCGAGALAGQAIVEWVDGGDPAWVQFIGPPEGLVLDVVEQAHWSGVLRSESQRVAPGAVVPFTLGHCGLSHVVDFDGSFWVLVGELNPNVPEAINAAQGTMQLLAPNRAQFMSGGNLIATLARFPGPKHVYLCD